jgi:2-oxoglutarate dehydrogenase E2 component (dihydrolipoamide succinyltransferase)
MPIKVVMPQLGESVDEGTITRWLKSKGENVEEFEPLLEVNTDKIDTEIPSPSSGILLKIIVEENSTVQAGELLAWIGEVGETIPDDPMASGETTKETKETISSEVITPTKTVSTQSAGKDRDLGFISPIVAKIASEYSIDLYQVTGTGKGGRITKKDLQVYLENRKKSVTHLPPLESTPNLPGAGTQSSAPTKKTTKPDEVLSLGPVRRSIAEHMVRSRRTSPHVTTVMEVNLNRVVAHRQEHKEEFSQDGVNLTFTTYFVSAVITALKAYPMVNSSWSDDSILLHREINIGMATSLGEEGLIVPVIKNADGLSLLGLARTINDLSNRARAHRLNPDEVQNGTFTITNHGTSGSLFATPIINQPQCAILGVGMIQKRVIVIDDAIAMRPMAYISLTFDHRILDGAIADTFLATVVRSLQNWR